MDTSKTYIKMRLKAIPDLGMGTPPDCSIGVKWVGDKVFIDCKGDWYYSDEDEAVQLERQEDLQAMVFPVNSTNPHRLIGQLNIFYDYWDENGIPTIFTSWEQLWLAFVQKELRNKVWDVEDWIDG